MDRWQCGHCAYKTYAIKCRISPTHKLKSKKRQLPWQPTTRQVNIKVKVSRFMSSYILSFPPLWLRTIAICSSVCSGSVAEFHRLLDIKKKKNPPRKWISCLDHRLSTHWPSGSEDNQCKLPDIQNWHLDSSGGGLIISHILRIPWSLLFTLKRINNCTEKSIDCQKSFSLLLFKTSCTKRSCLGRWHH